MKRISKNEAIQEFKNGNNVFVYYNDDAKEDLVVLAKVYDDDITDLNAFNEFYI